MPHRHLRQLAALGAAIAMIPALAACGDDNPDTGDIPDDAVAVVGDTAIEQETFDRWVANHSRAQGLRQAPVPPRYEGASPSCAGSREDRAWPSPRKRT